MTGRHRRTYLAGAEGRAAYDRAAARNTTPLGDPQRTLAAGPDYDPRRLAADLAVLCCCADTKGAHRRRKDGQRGACTVATAAGPCGCRRFTPRPVTEGEPDDDQP